MDALELLERYVEVPGHKRFYPAVERVPLDGVVSSFDSANSSRQSACRPLNRRDPGKHRRFRNGERPGVEFIARLAAALDDEG